MMARARAMGHGPSKSLEPMGLSVKRLVDTMTSVVPPRGGRGPRNSLAMKPSPQKLLKNDLSGMAANEPFRLLVESVKDYAIFLLDAGGHVITWNAGAARINGYQPAEILGKHFTIFYPPEDIAAGKTVRELEIATREGRFEEEGWRVRKDGSRLWANVTITAVRGTDGEVIGFAKVTRDLTERRVADEQMRRF